MLLPLVLMLPDGNLFFSNKKRACQSKKRSKSGSDSRKQTDQGLKNAVSMQISRVLVMAEKPGPNEHTSGYGRSCSNY
jgi:hypothetical protein